MAVQTSLQLSKRIARLPRQWRSGLALWQGLGLLILFWLLWAGYTLTSRPITLIINNQAQQIRTRHQTVGAVIENLNLPLQTADQITPPPEALLPADDTITINLARPIIIEVNGQKHTHLTHQQTIGAILTEAGITTTARDEILIASQPFTLESALPPPIPTDPAPETYALFAATTPQGAVTANRPQAVKITLYPAMSVTLYDGQYSNTFYTSQPTIEYMLKEQDISLGPADRVTPTLDSQLSTDMEIYIERAISVVVQVDGQTFTIDTHSQTVGDVLLREGIALMGQDFSHPALNQPLAAEDVIEIVRVKESVEVSQETIPFETEWIPDQEMLLDQQEVRQSGQHGLSKTRERIHYENGQETWRQLEDEWVDQEPQNRVIAYGTKIVIRTLQTEAGPLEYWRKINMRSSSYSAATSGKSPDHPQYGITRSGLQAGFGIVAVDIKVIPLMTPLYIDGYGQGLAGDTGGRVLGIHIDLGYDEGQPLPDMFGWRDVYVLTPVPPTDQIRYVLPQWPQR